MSDSTYNGWANYETWAVGLYLDGNHDGEGTYLAVLELVEAASSDPNVENIASGVWTDTEARLYAVEDALKDWTREQIEDGVEGIASDLLGSALDEVNWRELAGHKLAEVRENASV